MNIINKRFLQLFADGAAAGACPGVTAGPGQPTEAKGDNPTAQAAAAQVMEENARPTWEQLMADPEYNKCMQQLISNRLKEAKQAKARLDALSPALRHLALGCGMDPDNIDHQALSQAILAQAAQPEKQENVTKLHTLRQQAKDLVRAHRENLDRQAEALQQVFPDFDLELAMQDPRFARMVSPGVGLSVTDAYHALHHKELQALTARTVARHVARQVAASVAGGASRVAEHGIGGSAPSVTTTDYRNAPPQAQEALKQQIRAAAARGEKVYPR